MKKRKFKRNAKLLQASKMESFVRPNPFPYISVEQSQRISKVLSITDDQVNELGSFLMTANQKNGLENENSPCPVELLRKYKGLIEKYATTFSSCFEEIQDILIDMKPCRGEKVFRAGYQTLAGMFSSSLAFVSLATAAVERGETDLPYVHVYMLLSSNYSTLRSLYKNMRNEFVMFLSRHDDEDLDDLCPCEHCQPKPPKEGGTTIH